MVLLDLEFSNVMTILENTEFQVEHCNIPKEEVYAGGDVICR